MYISARCPYIYLLMSTHHKLIFPFLVFPIRARHARSGRGVCIAHAPRTFCICAHCPLDFFLQPFNSFLSCRNTFSKPLQLHTHHLVIAVSHTAEMCAGCTALSDLQVIMSSKAASKLLLQSKPCALSHAVAC